jgi:hypothetical protein
MQHDAAKTPAGNRFGMKMALSAVFWIPTLRTSNIGTGAAL